MWIFFCMENCKDEEPTEWLERPARWAELDSKDAKLIQNKCFSAASMRINLYYNSTASLFDFVCLCAYLSIHRTYVRWQTLPFVGTHLHNCVCVCVSEWKKTVRLFFLCQFHNISNTWCNKNQTPCTSIQRKWQSVPNNNNSNQNSNVRNFCLLLAHKMLSINYLVDFSSFSSSSSLFLIDVYPI